MTTTFAISNLKGGVANTRGTAQYRALAQELIAHG